MIKSWVYQMEDSCSIKMIDPVISGKGSIKSQIYTIFPLLHITPREVRATISQVFKTTNIDHLPKSIHLPLGPWNPPPPQLLLPRQNLIKITIAQPREIKLSVQNLELFLGLLSSMWLWVPIETSNSPPKTWIMFCNNSINKTPRISQNLQINFSPPQQS